MRDQLNLLQDVNDQYIYKYPVLYSAGQKRAYFNLKVFWRWIIFAAVHGLVTYFGTSHVSLPLFVNSYTGPCWTS